MQRAHYVRLYADERGESHFEDLELTLAPMDFAPPAAPLNLAQFLPTAQSYWIGATVGWEGEEPHPTPRRQIFCILRGEAEVTASDHTVRQLTAGSVLVLEDTWGKGHSTRITSAEDVLIFGVALAIS
jgi:mannose-6-phosphate isomerase-like protein (cupin superfamily)